MLGCDGPIYVLGLDGATFDLIMPWAKVGKLPNFTLLLDTGVRSKLSSTIQPMTPVAWTSFQTGVNPGKHGVFHFMEADVQKPYVPVGSKSLKVPPMWSYLQGHTIGLLNLFGTYPPQPANGFVVVGRNAPRGGKLSHPSELQDQIETLVDGYVVDIDPFHAPDLENVSERDFLGLLHEMLDKRIRVFDYLADLYSPDLFISVFMATDMVQHFFWHYMDQAHPLHDRRASGELKNAILNVYCRIDEFLGTLLARLGDTGTLIVLSDHGFGPWHYEISLNRWLTENAYLVPRSPSQAKGRQRLKQLLGNSGLGRSILGHRRKIKRKMHQTGASLYERLPVNWAQTRAFAVGHYGNIFINDCERFPKGIVEPGSGYEQIRTEISNELLRWQNPLTGDPVVRKVFAREELYSGDQLEWSPDLVIQWYDYAYLSSRASGFSEPLFGPVPCFYSNMVASGSHRLEGILMARGPSFKKGYELRGASVFDLAPTILYLMGAEVPEHMDGRVLEEAIKPEVLRTRPVTIGGPDAHFEHVDRDEAVFSTAESEEIRIRLAGLGYMD